MTKTLIFATMLSVAATVQAADKPRSDDLTAPQALELTLEALRRGEAMEESAQAQLAEQTLERLRKDYGHNILVNETLAGVAGKTDASSLRQALWEIATTLSFQPVMQASLPEDFPDPSTLGEIVVKTYPSYRRATAVNVNENLAFFTLFAHIQAKRIAMTAPVEMNWDASNGPEKAATANTMSFLYQSQNIGEVGNSVLPGVKVVDMPPQTVVSVGITGKPNPPQLAQYETALREWVKANRAEDAEVLGPPRLLGYNDPRQPKQYWEFQLPLPPRE
jgi:hypothetical protein